MTRHLAESDKYSVTSEYEYATLHFKNRLSKKSVYLGDFYGDPNCAIISKDEKYLVVAGCGLIIYRLKEPFREYGNDDADDQYFEFFRHPSDIWWINGLTQEISDVDWKYFRFVAANSDGEFKYRMDAESFKIEKVDSLSQSTFLG